MAKLAKRETFSSLVEQIENGELDDDLRDIVRACCLRRYTLDPHSYTGVLSAKLAKTYKPKGNAQRKADATTESVSDVDVSAFVPVTRFQTLLGGSGEMVSLIVDGQKYRFYRDTLKGKQFFYDNDSPAALKNVSIGVVDIDSRTLSFKILTQPNNRKGRFYTAWIKGDALQADLNNLKLLTMLGRS